MVRRMWLAALLVAAAMLPAGMGRAPGEEVVPRMTAQELEGRLGEPDLVLLDVRKGKDWARSEQMIRGALRADPDKAEKWAGDYPREKTIVLYCA